VKTRPSTLDLLSNIILFLNIASHEPTKKSSPSGTKSKDLKQEVAWPFVTSSSNSMVLFELNL